MRVIVLVTPDCTRLSESEYSVCLYAGPSIFIICACASWMLMITVCQQHSLSKAGPMDNTRAGFLIYLLSYPAILEYRK